MDNKDLNKYFALEKQITEEANDLLKWFSKNVNDVMDVEDLRFDCIEDGIIFYDGCKYKMSFTLTSNLLLLDKDGREKYAEQFKVELAEKQRLENEKHDEELAKNRINQEIYERAELERLKKKYD